MLWFSIKFSTLSLLFCFICINNAEQEEGIYEGRRESLLRDVFILVSNLSDINLDWFFSRPKPAVFQPKPNLTTPAPITTTENFITSLTEQTEDSETFTIKPQSPLGYDIPCGVRGSFSTKIVGGSNAERGEFPWQISLQLVSGLSSRHICGGTVLTPNWIITAAHCVAGLRPAFISIVAGDYNLYNVEGNEQRVSVVRIVGRNYVRENFTDDIALLQVSPPLELDGIWVAPLCLPNEGIHFGSGYGTVTGWGRLTESGGLPHVLQKVSLPIVSKASCRRLYKNAGYSSYLNSCQICSGWEQGGLDSCQGDSGGPLACQLSDGLYYLCGIVSWGVGCARPRFPGVYTEVTCYSTWVADIIYNRGNALQEASNLL